MMPGIPSAMDSGVCKGRELSIIRSITWDVLSPPVSFQLASGGD